MSGPQVTGAPPPQKKKKKKKKKTKEKKRRKTGRFRANPLTTHIHRLQSNRRNHTHLNAGLRLEPSCLSPVNAVQHGRQIDRLWDRDYGVKGLELSAELSMRHKVKVERGWYFQDVPVGIIPNTVCATKTESPRTHLHVVGMLWFMFFDTMFMFFDINQPSLPTPFYSVLLSISVFMAPSTVFHSINSPDNSPLSHSVLQVLFPPSWSFQVYISLWKSPSALFSPDVLLCGWLGLKHQLTN